MGSRIVYMLHNLTLLILSKGLIPLWAMRTCGCTSFHKYFITIFSYVSDPKFEKVNLYLPNKNLFVPWFKNWIKQIEKILQPWKVVWKNKHLDITKVGYSQFVFSTVRPPPPSLLKASPLSSFPVRTCGSKKSFKRLMYFECLSLKNLQ